jgi:hypothetical protein
MADALYPLGKQALLAGDIQWKSGPFGSYWEQEIDMGVTLPGSRLALVTELTIRDGAPESEFTVQTSLNGVDWDSYGGLLEFYTSPFRYVKVRVEVNAP